MEMFLALFVFMLIGMALIYVLIGTMGIAAFLAVKLAIAAIYFIPTIIALYKNTRLRFMDIFNQYIFRIHIHWLDYCTSLGAWL